MAKIIKFITDLELTDGKLILGDESYGTAIPEANQLEENELFFMFLSLSAFYS